MWRTFSTFLYMQKNHHSYEKTLYSPLPSASLFLSWWFLDLIRSSSWWDSVLALWVRCTVNVLFFSKVILGLKHWFAISERPQEEDDPFLKNTKVDQRDSIGARIYGMCPTLLQSLSPSACDPEGPSTLGLQLHRVQNGTASSDHYILNSWLA